jgi:hypothetical protein
MADYPQTPLPSSVSAPEYLDEVLRFQTDFAYELRRAKHSRPRRRWTLEYLGKTTAEMHQIRDFFGTVRFGVFPFTFYHPTALDAVVFQNTTPITLSYNGAHGLMTGQMVGVFSSPGGNAKNGFYTITRVNAIQIALNGSTAGGGGVGSVRVYVPNAVGRFSDDTMPSPTKLAGPETASPQQNTMAGFWNFTVVIEEVL